MDVVRIADLRSPVLTAEQAAIRDALEERPVRLDAERLLAAARARTGLHDLGGEDVVDRLGVHVAAIESDTGLTQLGRLILRQRIARLLENRLRLEDLLARHPEIHDIELPAPLIVVGLPRSGTTHLVNLLAEDPRRRALPFWESQEPIPATGEGPGVNGIDPRFERCQAVYDAEQTMSPLTALMHDRFPAAIEEEVEVMDLDFASYTLEWHARVPSWRDAYVDFDHQATYAQLRTTLQAMTQLRGPATWVLKSPQHLEQLGPLIETFPDATVAFTHRDPVAVVTSAVTMLAYGDRMRRYEIEAEGLAAYWIDRVERLLRRLVADRGLVPAEQSIDIRFSDFMADELGTVLRFYERAGIAVPDEVRGRFEQYLEANPRGRKGRVAYDLAGDFGVDPAALTERFSFYLDTFGITPEIRSKV